MKNLLLLFFILIKTAFPQPNAGIDQEFILPNYGENVTVFLNATASQNITNFNWSQIAGPIVSLQNQNTLSPSFLIIGDRADRIGTYIFKLADNNAYDTVNIIAHSLSQHVPKIYPFVSDSYGNDINGGNIILNANNKLFANIDTGGDINETIIVYWSKLNGPNSTDETSSTTDLRLYDILNIIPSETGLLAYEVKAYDGMIMGPPFSISFNVIETKGTFSVNTPEVIVKEELEPYPEMDNFIGGGASGGCLLKK